MLINCSLSHNFVEIKDIPKQNQDLSVLLERYWVFLELYRNSELEVIAARIG